ncbi:hypothetical protein L5M43_21605 [Shewanella sp. SW36]|uniref:hypothetical protein n=1 Tax=unclassified Shewanella TaxID=196818 RepID=UPI0021D836A2|nr:MULTISPECIES: hypothetical protein [unclassified Shewanella]MCU7977808.1 hypothetical protein [Shewanella sp. SW36]MCU7993065.1 hypothetical protein [Shewanella sp. SW1]MCU8054311.1 hypothetical protein [Shewanella sp. SM43]
MISVKNLCTQLNCLEELSNCINESIDSYYIKGFASDEVEVMLLQLCDVLDDVSYQNYFTINIDSERVQFSDIQRLFDNHCAEFELTFDKKSFIQSLYSGAGDINEILYISANAFVNKNNGLGLENSLQQGQINHERNTRIHVNGLKTSFGGSRLAIIPVEDQLQRVDWFSGSSLPNTETIHQNVHIINTNSVKINPQQFELSWGDIDGSDARPFRRAFAKQLFVTLCTNYYTDDKVELKGVKHIQANILETDTEISSKMLAALSDCVKWCYSKEDTAVPLQLLIDRLSLECTESLFDLPASTLISALSQAKSNYKFVIAKKSDEYRKELKEIYKDIKTVTDKFAEKSLSLASESLKSLLTIGFIFTAGTISKAIVNNQLLHSKEGQLLFKIVGIYLVFSFLIRWLNSSADLKVSEQALKSWSKKLHDHISSQEIVDLIKKQTFWSKMFYWFSLAIVTAFQVSIAYVLFNSASTLFILGL